MTVCPNVGQHTPHPIGYIAHGEWAEQMMRTHDQRRCDGCGSYAAWEPKPGVTAAPLSPDLFERGCIAVRLHI